MNQMRRFIQNAKIQRVFYTILFLLFNGAVLPTAMQYTWSNSIFGIPYFYFWLIPSIILLYQIIFNNMIGWLTFFILYLVSVIFGFILGFNDIIECYNVKYSGGDIVLYIVICIILYLPFGWFIYLIKPQEG